MRHTIRPSVLAVFGLACFATAVQSQSAAPKPVTPEALPEVVARINGKEIKKGELLNRVRAVRAEKGRMGLPPDESAEFYHDVLDQIVGATLLYQESRAQGMAAPDTEVEGRLAAVKARFPEDDAFASALSAQGLTPDSLKEEIRLNLSVQKLVETDIASKIAVSEEAQKKFYDENQDQMKEPERVRVSHILVKADSEAPAEDKARARAKLEAVVAQIQKGEDFAKLARENSDDTGSKAQGGELPWISSGETVPPFEKAAFALKVGELSSVVESPFGFHVIKLHERKPAGQVPFEQAKSRIGEFLTQREIQEKVRERVEQLKTKAKIEVLI